MTTINNFTERLGLQSRRYIDAARRNLISRDKWPGEDRYIRGDIVRISVLDLTRPQKESIVNELLRMARRPGYRRHGERHRDLIDFAKKEWKRRRQKLTSGRGL